jgi:hypothetical protein
MQRKETKSMKNLIVVLVLVLCASVAFSQAKISTAKNFRAGTAMSNMAYTTTKKDTTQAFYPRLFKETALAIWTHDSASVAVYYQPSYDGVNFTSSYVLIDSLTGVSTADSSSATIFGNVKAFPLPAAAKVLPAVRFIINFNVFNCGVTTPRFDAKVVQIP